jgi:hypothetical protein
LFEIEGRVVDERPKRAKDQKKVQFKEIMNSLYLVHGADSERIISLWIKAKAFPQ